MGIGQLCLSLWGLLQEPTAGGNGSSESDFLCESLTPGNSGRVGFVFVVVFTVWFFFFFCLLSLHILRHGPDTLSWFLGPEMSKKDQGSRL